MFTLAAYTQHFDPVGNSLFASAIFAALPLITLFVTLGGLRWKAHWAALAALVVAILVAVIVYSMPVGQALDSGLEGAAFGLFPIMWIVFNAIWIYNMTDRTGYFAVLRRSFERVSDDERIQAIIIAFSFGALLEALAGFGTPVAITASMLVGLGFKPMKAAGVALVSNTAPVAFGAIAIPIITLAGITDLPKDDLGAMVGRQTPFLALDRPADPRRAWSTACAASASAGRPRWSAASRSPSGSTPARTSCRSSSRTSSPRCCRSARSSRSCASGSRASRCARSRASPGPPWRAARRRTPAFEAEARRREGGEGHVDSRRDKLIAYAPYVIIIAIFAIAQWNPLKTWMADNATDEVRLAGPRHPQRQGRGADARSRTSSTGCRPRARCC